MKIALKIAKYSLFALPAIVLLIIIIRLFMYGDPPESRVILNTPAFEPIHTRLGDDFIMHTISLRNLFTRGDTFCVADVLYLESSGDLQLSLRAKKNRLDDLSEHLSIPAERFADLLKLYMRVTTSYLIDIPGEIREETLVSEVFEVSQRYLFETNRYEYIRVNFPGINMDFRRTRLELFIFDINSEYDLENLDHAGFLGRVTIFDINMPRERANINRFEILR